MTPDDPRTRIGALFAPVGRLSPRRELISILLILTESMIVYIYAGVLLAERDSPYSPLPVMLIFTLMLISYQIPHLLESMRIWSPEYETLMVAGLFGTFLLVFKVGAFPHVPWFSLDWLSGLIDALILRPNESVRPVWGLVFLTVYAWWRGRTRAEPVIDTTYAMLRWGILFVAGGLTLSWLSAPPGAAISERTSIAVAGFVVFALLAIAVARQPSSDSSREWNAAWIWLAVFVLPITAILLASVSTAGVLSREVLDVTLSVLGPVFWAIGLALRAVILFIAVVTFILISPILWFLDRQDFGPFTNIPRLDIAPRSNSDIDEFARTTLDIGDPVRFLIAGMLLTAMGWFLVRFLFKRRKYWHETQRQQRESLIEWEDRPETLLRKAGGWIASRLGARRRDRFDRDPRWSGNRRVRRAYRMFLRLVADHGIQRRAGSTPNQLASDVIQIYAPIEQAVTLITDHYNRARYSGEPLTDSTAKRAESALHTVSDHLKERSQS